jgi:hypothetical protein
MLDCPESHAAENNAQATHNVSPIRIAAHDSASPRLLNGLPGRLYP